MVYAALLFKKFTKTAKANKITFVKGKQQCFSQEEFEEVLEKTNYWDLKFIVGFPLCFLIFNSIYWPVIIFNQPLDIQPASKWEV